MEAWYGPGDPDRVEFLQALVNLARPEVDLRQEHPGLNGGRRAAVPPQQRLKVGLGERRVARRTTFCAAAKAWLALTSFLSAEARQRSPTAAAATTTRPTMEILLALARNHSMMVSPPPPSTIATAEPVFAIASVR